MKIIVAHPEQQHSFRVAEALKKKGLLLKFFTPIYNKQKNNFAMRLANKLIKNNDVERMKNRSSVILDDDDVIQQYTFLALVVIIFSRISLLKKLALKIDRYIANRFGIKVAKYAIKHNVDAVVCFSENELKCFKYIKKHAPHIKCITDCASAPIQFMRYICDRDISESLLIGEKNQLKKEVPSFWSRAVCEREAAAFAKTDYFFAPSEFVKKGLVFCGVDICRIKIVPYGTNFTSVYKNDFFVSGDISFIYVGQITYRKGVHHLLNVFANMPEKPVIHLYGAWMDGSEIYKTYKEYDNIIFHGNVLRNEVAKALKVNDVLIFASLTEGLSLACLEALSSGVPVICTKNSGVNDVIQDGINGFTINAGDRKAIENRVRWFINNKDKIPNMSKNATETGKKYTWENHAVYFANALSDILNE